MACKTHQKCVYYILYKEEYTMSSYNEFYKFLIKSGCQFVRQGAGSCKMLKGINGKEFPFHDHGAKEMSKDTQQKILKQAGLK